jgi:nitrate/nitrite transporter NarK
MHEPVAAPRTSRTGPKTVLAVFTLLAAVTQLLWLNFAPLITLLRARYGVSELSATMLVLVFPLLYVLLSIPAGMLVDRRGYRFAVGLGGTVTALFATLRIWDEHFATLLVAQVGIAVAQPFVINGISKLVADWFSEEHGAIATGIGTMGMFLGMAVAMAVTPSLVASTSLSTAMLVFAVVAWLAALLFWAFGRERSTQRSGAIPKGAGLAPLLRDRDLRRLFMLAFLGLGFFNAFTTWLEPIMAPQGFDAESAGAVGGTLIAGGIVGSVVVPALSDRLKRRKPFLLLCALLALPTVYPLCNTRSQALALGLGFALGFVLLPAFALLLEMCSERAGREQAGNATGLLMLMGNAGGVVMTLCVDLVRGGRASYAASVWLLMGALAVTVLLATTVRERA